MRCFVSRHLKLLNLSIVGCFIRGIHVYPYDKPKTENKPTACFLGEGLILIHPHATTYMDNFEWDIHTDTHMDTVQTKN